MGSRAEAWVAWLPKAQRGRATLLSRIARGTVATLLLAPPAHAQPAPNARPSGGVVTAGSATLGSTASTTTITQSSQRAAINWHSFDVGAHQTVDFVQPSASAVALNRVISPNPSQIAGRIDANGQIILINQSGVIFYQGAQVNTAGLIVSAAGMSDVSFMAGKLVFDQAARPNAAVVNQGTLTVGQAGLAALVAPQVVNAGVITAKLGQVVLAGAKTATLDLYGDGMLSLDVSNAVTQAPVGPNGQPATALVTNTGVIGAAGGTVQLTAREADGLVQNLVRAGGKISADSVGSKTGTVVLGGLGGSIVLSGVVTADGAAPGSVGGQVQVDASRGVTLAAGSRISASGAAGGGTVAIGTTLARAKGGPGTASALTASTVQVAAGASIAANAWANGNGGRVTVLSSESTAMAGDIATMGGPQGGDGGLVETSGESLGVASSAVVDTSARAPTGTAGAWLLDPADITISNSATSGVSLAGATFNPTASTSTDNLSSNALEMALATGNVLVETICLSCTGPLLGSIVVSDPVTWSSNSTLTLHADNNIAINAAITGSGAGSGLTLTSGLTTATGSITLSSPISVNTFTALALGSGGINLNDGAGPLVATSGGGQTYNSPVVLQADASLAETGAGRILFTHAVDGDFGLTVGAGTGMVIFGGAVGGTTPLASLTVTGPTMLGADITTNGSQTYNSAVTLVATETLTTAANGAVDFASTVDAATAGSQGLTVSAGTGTVTFGGAVGGSAALASLTMSSPTTLDANVTTTGGQIYNSAVTLGATDMLATTANGAIDFAQPIDGGTQSLTLTSGSGAQTLSGITTSGNLTLNTTGTVTLDGGTYTITGVAPYVFPAVTTNGVLTLGQATEFGALTLGGATTISSGDAAVDLTSTVNGAFGLTVNAGAGAVTFAGAVGGSVALASLMVTGPAMLDGNVTTSGAQTYNSAVTLGRTDTLETTANGAIDFAQPIGGGARALTLNSGSGAQTLNGIKSGDLTLITTGTVTLDGGTYAIGPDTGTFTFPAVTTNGTLVLSQATNFGTVTLGNTTSIGSNNDTAVGFNGTVNGGFGLTVNVGTGTVTFTHTVGTNTVGGTTALASLTVTGPTTLDSNVTSSGTQTYNSPVTLGGAATLATTANGAIDFVSTVDGGFGLVVNAGAGTVTFGDAVGGTTALASLTVMGATTLNGRVRTTGTQAYNSAVTLGATGGLTTTANGAVDLVSTMDGSFALTVSVAGTGTVTFGRAVGGTTALAGLTATGPTTLDGNVTTNGAQTYNNAVTLGDTDTLKTTTNGAVDFTSTVDGGFGLTVSAAGTGTVTFGGAVGGLAALASLTATSPATLDGNVRTNGAQTYNSAVTLGAADTLTTINAAITLDGQATAGAHSLVLTSGSGSQTLSGITTSGNLTLTTTGTVTLEAGTYTIRGGANPYVFPAVTTNGVLTLGQATRFGAVTLGGATTINSSNMAVNFVNTVDATTAGGQGLTVNAGTGIVMFGGAVGRATPPASLMVTGPATLHGNVTTMGTQTYNSAVTLSAPLGGIDTLTTTNSAIDFAGAVDAAIAGGQGLAVSAGTATVTFGGVVGGSAALASLMVSSPTRLDGNVTTSGMQTYDSVVMLGATDTLVTANAAITFDRPVTGGTNSLTLTSGRGDQTLNGITTGGNLTLTTTGTVTLDGGTYTITGGANPYAFPAVTTNGILTLGQPTSFGAVTLGSTTTIDSSNLAVDFASTVNGAFGLTVDAGTGAVTFHGVVGGTTALGSLTLTDPTLDANVTTTGAQTYDSAVTLGAADILATTNSPIDFASTVNGAFGLIVNAGIGVVTFGGAVGGTMALASLAVTGPTALDGNVMTSGAQTYNSAVTLGSSDTLTTTNGAVDFAGTVDAKTPGGQSLTVSAGTSTVTFGDAVGGSAVLFSLTVTGPTTLNGNVTTSRAQTYNSAVTLGATDRLTTTNATVDVGSTVDATVAGSQGLTISAGTGIVTFGGAVGGSVALANVIVTGPTTLGGNVTTSGQQIYNSAVTLAAIDTLSTTNAAVDFAGTVNATTAGGEGLAVNAGSGTVTFDRAVGGLAALASLAVTGPTTLDGNVTTSGAQTYNSAITLGATDTLATTNSAVDFTGTVDATTAGTQGLTVNAAAGSVTFGAVVGGTAALARLTVIGPTTLDGNVTTTGMQTYDSAVTLGAPFGGIDTLTTTNSAIDFTSTVDAAIAGSQGLTISAGAGAVTFGGAMGGTTALASLTVTGPTTLDDNVTTTGAQTYNSAVTLGAADTLTTFNAALDFASTVDATTAGSQDLTVDAGAGTITFAGTIGGTTKLASLMATGGTITLDGNARVTGALVLDSTGSNSTLAISTRLSAATVGLIGPAISISGAITGTTNIGLTAGVGGVTAAGSLTTPLLIGSAMGNVALTGTANTITALGASAASPFNSTGEAFSLTDASALTVNGVTANTVVLTAPVLTIPGAITGTASVTLATDLGGISETPTGVVTTALLTGNALGSVTLAGTANAITGLGTSAASPFNNSGQAFSLTDASALAVNGVAANTIALAAPSFTIPGAIITPIPTPIAGAASVTLTANLGGISEAPTGIITTALLTGSALGDVTLAGTANAIIALGTSAALLFDDTGHAFSLTDASELTMNGVTANTVVLTAPSLAIPGLITTPITIPAAGAVSVTLTATTGGISEAPTGVVTTALLTGGAAGAVSLTQTNNLVGTLATFTAGNSFTLTDNEALTLRGTISAPLIVVDTQGNPLTMATGTKIVTGGIPAPSELTIAAGQLPTATRTRVGAYFASGTFQQIGIAQVTSSGSGASIVVIDAMHGKDISFDPAVGLNAALGPNGTNTWLVLELSSAGGLGSKVSGYVYVKSLTVDLPPGAAASDFSVALNGSVNGIGGQEAASEGGAVPVHSATLQFNHCPIGTIGCVLLSGALVPTGSPVRNLTLGVLMDPNDEGELLLPLVSDQDFLLCALQAGCN